MCAYKDQIRMINAARQQRDRARDNLYKSLMRRIQLKKTQRSSDREGDVSSDINSDGAVNIPDGQREREVFRRTEAVVSEGIRQLFGDFGPEKLIEEWNDDYPIMLMPVRMETKFKIETNELLVRVYPDDIAVTTHEKTLTQKEFDFGKLYWKSLMLAGTDETKKKEAWRKIAEKFGANRAAWVAKQMKPANYGEVTPGNPDALVFPSPDLIKPDAWTEAPHTKVLPDQFVLMGFNESDQLILSQKGNFIKDVVITGPSPAEEEDKPSLTRDETDNRIKFSDDFLWIKDFNRAVEEGLGFRVPLTEVTQTGFAKLMVIGLKLSAAETEGKEMIEELIDNHHYSRKGFSVVRQGSPTNNTEDEDAAFNSKDPMQELSYWVETGNTLFSATRDLFKVSDGQRLAEYLGIEYEPLQYIANSDSRDHDQATAMNAALCGVTIDYFLSKMLNGVFSSSMIEKLRDHFVHHVTGRGPLPAFRIGKQPYGLLVTSSSPLWKFPQRGDVPGVITRFDNFLPQLWKVIQYFESEWKKLLPQTAKITSGTNAGASLMNVLGLHPGSVEFFQRVAYTKDDIENKGLLTDDKYWKEIMDLSFQNSVVRMILQDLGHNEKEPNGKQKPLPLLLQLIYQRYHTRLDKLNLIDGQPLSEKEKIKPFSTTSDQHFIDWLLANASDPDKLEKQDFGGAPAPHSLLYLMLHFSLINETAKGIGNYLNQHDITATELLQPRKMMNMSSGPSVSAWEIFKTPVNLVVTGENVSTQLYTFMHSAHFDRPEYTGLVSHLKENKLALEELKKMSTASLERALAEHIDTLTYRLDSWQTSVFDIRLRTKRNLSAEMPERRKGLYIGSFGYLENVRPATKPPQKISEEILPEKLREGTGNLYRYANNGGYVHAPSLNHATAAAILRNGFLTYSSKDEKELLSVNLSSERVRRAMYLIEGVRNGQTIEALLGYQFERGFHDFSTRSPQPVILNHLIPYFRKNFPVKKTKIPQQGKVTGPEEVTDDFSVVNGLSIVNSADSFPDGLPSLPVLSAEQKTSIRYVKNVLANTLDAFHDVIVAESAYQLAMGNFDRAAALVQSIANGDILPEIEVINTPRGTDLSITNRLVIHFDPAITANPWTDIAMTPRALTEAAVNNWLAGLLGDPALIRCKVTAVDSNGATLIAVDDSPIEKIITLKELKLQAIDFVYLVNRKQESGFSELENRIRHAFLAAMSLTEGTLIKITFTASSAGAPVAGVRSFADIFPTCYYLREVLTTSRPMTARDYQSQSKDVTGVVENPDNVQINEMITRVTDVYDEMKIITGELQTAVQDARNTPSVTTLNTVRDKLIKLADTGITDAFPHSGSGFTEEITEQLLSQGESVIRRFDEFTLSYLEEMTKVNGTKLTIEQKVTALTSLAKGMMGSDFVLLPRFNFTNLTDVAKSAGQRDALLKHSKNVLMTPLPVDEWLHGAALVRKKVRTFELARTINDSNANTFFDIQPLQVPYRVNDHWLAVEFPEGHEILHDTISFGQYLPQGFTPSALQSGLVVDDWTEFIPKKEETTGITFNYNQPNSSPPQTVLLAVSPEEATNWKWDHLVDIVLDTFRRARLRAVEPDMIDKVPGLTTLLPAIVSEFSTGANNVSLDFAMNIKEVYTQVKDLSTII